MVWKDITDRRMLLEHVLWSVPRLAKALISRDLGTLYGSLHAIRRLPQALAARTRARTSFTRSDRGEVLALVSVDAVNSPTR